MAVLRFEIHVSHPLHRTQRMGHPAVLVVLAMCISDLIVRKLQRSFVGSRSGRATPLPQDDTRIKDQFSVWGSRFGVLGLGFSVLSWVDSVEWAWRWLVGIHVSHPLHRTQRMGHPAVLVVLAMCVSDLIVRKLQGSFPWESFWPSDSASSRMTIIRHFCGRIWLGVLGYSYRENVR
jgi:hypothetical protein